MRSRPARDLDTALLHIEVLREHLSRDDFEGQIVHDAVAIRLMSAIEAVSRLDEPLLSEAFGTTWKEIRGMRNLLAHGYEGVAPEELLLTAHTDLDDFESRIRALRARIADDG